MKDSNTLSRREMRALVMKAMYAREMTGDPINHLRKTVLEDLTDDSPEYNYAAKMLNKLVNEPDDVLLLVDSHLKNWDMDRVAVIDRILLLMGVAEFLYFEDIPPKVTINEMIEIAKEFSTEKSGHFVNGILDAIHNDLKKDGRMNKSGRGLVNQ